MKDEKNENKGKFNRGEFGKRLREVRKKSKVTSDKLGFACGVNPVFIRQIEAGARMPSIPVFVKICDNLQVSPAYLLENEIQNPVTNKGWGELEEELRQLSETSRSMVREVLHSLIENLAEQEKKWEKNEERYGKIGRASCRERV